MTNLIGQTVGRYEILELLGEGGMALVYKALDTQLEREVAIKFIRAEIISVEDADVSFKRFKREARLLARLSHPNILTLLDYGQHENQVYLITSYLPGGSLKARLDKPVPWQEAADLLYPIARALEYAHSQNILHRDIKPANILLSSSGIPVLADFGLAKLLEGEVAGSPVENAQSGRSQLTLDNMSVGTPDYMAPEQGGGKADFRSDIYSLGVVFYEMVTGRRPFIADTPLKVLLMHITDPLPPPCSIFPELPIVIEKVILKALEKDPQNRYQSMAEFADAVHQCTASHEERTRAFEVIGAACLQAQTGEVFALNSNSTVLGRGNKKSGVFVDIDLAPFDTGKIVSRRHAVIEKQSGQFVLKDQNSVNGTWVNNQRLEPRQPHPLQPGDVITFGRNGVQMKFVKG